MRAGKLKAIGLFFIVLLAGCGLEEKAHALSANQDTERTWAFFQFNVPEEGGALESYYYYGSVSKHLYQQISHNQIDNGFIVLEKVRYWGEDDLVHRYQNEQNAGVLIFRIEDIKRVSQLKNDPILGPDSAEQQVEKNTAITKKPSAKKVVPATTK